MSLKLSVIIPTYNGADNIGDQLEALASQQWSDPWELIISDNGSTDRTLEIVDQFSSRFPALRVINSSNLKGVGFARNMGAFAAEGEFIAFLDQDDEVGKGWLAAIGSALQQNDFVAARMDAKKLNEQWTLKVRFPTQQKALMSNKSYGPGLPWGVACTLAIKRSIHLAIGGFDESMVGGEDYCWRVQLAGTELHFAPEAVIHYRFRHRLPDIFGQALSYGKDQVGVYKKWHQFKSPKNPFLLSLLSWGSVALNLPLSLSDKGSFARWLWRFGYRYGMLKGSIKHRTILCLIFGVLQNAALVTFLEFCPLFV